jgi:alpha-D-xyloside xylohydrolase
MKFRNGYWKMRPGLTAHEAVQVYDVEADEEALTVFAPTNRVTGRGDTINEPVMTVRFSSPMANVIRVEAHHHKGGREVGPKFEISTEGVSDVEVSNEAEAAMLTSGELSVRVEKAGDWQVQFIGHNPSGDRVLTQSGWRALGFVDVAPSQYQPDRAPTALTAMEGYASRRYIKEELSLGVGECVYGLGERFTAFVKNGQVVDMWNADGGTASEQAYKNVPFYMTNRGYGVFVAHPEKVSFEVASEKVERVQFSVPGETLTYYVIYGPTPKEVLERYTALTGRPALPPAWSFGLWLTTSFTTDYDEATVTHFIEGMAERDLPLHVFHFDCFWMKAYHWSDFVWDEELFPDPEAMLARLKARGLRICVWINPYIAERSRLFEEGMANGYLLKRPNGDVWQWDIWQAGMGLVDFTNPEACEWYGDKLRALVDMGVDCFKTDFGERIPTDVVYDDGSDPFKMHNYYTLLYNQTVFDVLTDALGEGEAVLFARSATAGSQKYPVHWGGDSTATFESMAETLRGGLSLGMSGFGFWSHDMGGFEQTASADVYKRWCAFGLLSSHSRLHGASSYRVPWLFDEEAVDVLRFFTKLKCRLMPYLFGAAVEARETGAPVLRAMHLEFPEDPGCDTLDRQYMLGDSLLVAPVFSHDGSVDVYVPEGRWTHLLSGACIEGGGWIHETYDAMSLPLLARPNCVIPMGSVDIRPDYAYADGVTFHIFELAEGATASAVVPSLDGEIAMRLSVRREGDLITVEPENASASWSVLLRGIEGVASVEGGRAESDAWGVRVFPDGDVKTLRVAL